MTAWNERAANCDGLAALGDATGPSVLAGRLRVTMVRLGRQLRRQDPSGMSISLYSALATVAARGELAIGELGDAESLPSSAATRAADRLEVEGFVERRRNPNDRRGVNVAITPKGQEFVEEQRRKGNAWLADRLARLSRAERATLAEALGVLEALVGDADGVDAEGDVSRRAVTR